MIYTVEDILRLMRGFLPKGCTQQNYKLEEPLRSELLSCEQMNQHSKTLARSHIVHKKNLPNQLLIRLDDNEKVLLEVRNLLTKSIKENSIITSAGEWLLDNFYLIEEQIRTSKKHLPKKYSEGLPQLASGPSAGLPLVYDVALEIVSHSDGRINIENLNIFLNGYQTVKPLSLGELWAIPIMLRLALIENLRRVCARIAISKINRFLADHWAGRMIEMAQKNPKNLILEIADMARSNPPMEMAFVAEFERQLHGKGPALAQPLHWIEEQLAETGQTTNELVRLENQQQASDQVSVSNSIGSLKLLGGIDWRDFVEDNSLVEKILREDEVYGLMDFTTRNNYRQVIERVAKNSNLQESAIAQIVIDLANENAQTNTNKRASHIGFFLIDDGLLQTQIRAKIKFSVLGRLRCKLARHNLIIYLGTIFLLTAALTALVVCKANADGNSLGVIVAFGILSFICISQLAVSLTNFFAALIVKPSLLPRLDFSTKIPESSRTLVTVPTMLTSKSNIDNLVEALEVRFLANKNENLHFALLTDFADANQEEMPEDAPLLEFAVQKMVELNQKYGREKNDLFFLFHRPRKFNAVDKIWMGYERKRGKLGALNGLLRGESKNCFSYILADQSILPQIKYVITLDSDTGLPRESAWKIIATMAHPLNRAVYCEEQKRVVKGYGILQPRISMSMPDVNSSIYSRIDGSEAGIDPYTKATSDIYQDLFGEGSFIGKGIYEVDIFEKALKGKLPENRILSHDLLEGCYVRSGLLSDVQLYEKHPTSYHCDMMRRHRWIRGDWQIASWFLPFAPSFDKRWHKNQLCALSRWKIFDNIRRSIVPIAFTAFTLMAWLVGHSAAFWTLIITATIILPVVLSGLWDIFCKPKDLILSHHILVSGRSACNKAITTLFIMICLPFEAFMNLEVILRTLWRTTVTGKHLLDWVAFDKVESGKPQGLLNSYCWMFIEPLLAVLVFVYLFIISPSVLCIALPILLLWLFAPLITFLVSKPFARQKEQLSADEILFLQKLSRKTWSFFEQFVTVDENWLPPDNYQEDPVSIIAHQVSPTNIGISLLANLCAFDFGYITMGEFTLRTAGAFKSLQSMERFNGHFYNWYNTLSLKPLFPRYISTVDSGNLAGHILTLRQGIYALANQPAIGLKLLNGIKDALNVLTDKVEQKGNKLEILENFKIDFELLLTTAPATVLDIKEILEKLRVRYEAVQNMIDENSTIAESRWVAALGDHIHKPLDEIKLTYPWLFLPATPDKFKNIFTINNNPTLNELAQMSSLMEEKISQQQNSDNTTLENEWLKALQESIIAATKNAKNKLETLAQLASQCADFAEMEYDFLYSKTKHLMSIGYNVEDHKLDASFYDLLASEARLGTFVGIAQGKLPQESWFSLDRLLTNSNNRPILLSWSGSMFEYLMPLLVMPSYQNTLLSQTNETAVLKQVRYGKKRGVPWGISESCYNRFDADSNYQYRAFGVPGIGLKRGIGEELVIAPYATALALMVSPKKAFDNLQAMEKLGFEGEYGFYEAIDYTPSRLPRGENSVIIKSYMAHHQGMSLLSMAYLLLDKPMQKRFEAEPQFQATLLLLQEKIPKATAFFAHTTNIAEIATTINEPQIRIIDNANTTIPEVQLLSNGKYHIMITNSGGGYSRWKDLAITRWREDATRDNWGTFCYIRDLETGKYWSTTFQPTLEKIENFEVAFSQGRADFRGRCNNIETHTEIAVSPEDDIEIRRLNITNRGSVVRTIEITSYAEIVIATQAADLAHIAFSNLFVQTQILPQSNAIFCTRRPGSKDEKQPFMVHIMNSCCENIEKISFETDRMKFIGRGNTTANPQAMKSNDPLTGSEGSVLDPIVAIRYKLTIQPQETVVMDMILGIGETREICQSIVDKYQDKYHKDRIFEMAWTHNQAVLRQINTTESEAQLYTRLANSIIFINPALRADPAILVKNHRGQSCLWSYSISGDLPIVLLKIEEHTDIKIAKQMMQAHIFWRLKGLFVDLLIWNDSHDTYRQTLQTQITDLLGNQNSEKSEEKLGRIFIRGYEQMSNEDRILFQSVARIVITSGESLSSHIERKIFVKAIMPPLAVVQEYSPSNSLVKMPDDLLFFNGFGGFAADGREYVINITNEKMTPAPWVNVIANPHFGTVISESGSCYTWKENAHELRLTPWENDPVSDLGGEAFYLRDEETGRFWTTTPLPGSFSGGESNYITRHGFGYSVFEHEEAGIYSQMRVCVDVEAAIKFTTIKIKNNSGRPRRITATGYVQWVLGELRSKTIMHITTEIDPISGAIFARNPYSRKYGNRVAFFDAEGYSKTFTADRAEFIGRNNSLKNPAAMGRAKLSGKVGIGLDPCAAIQISMELLAEEEKEVIFKLGEGKDSEEARHLVAQFSTAASAHNALDKVVNFWKNTVDALQVETPDKSVNLLANGWLTYQTLSSRLWGRSGYYQSGGAFGFRDQLQDSLALIHSKPELVREHILLCASRQFEEGDVQHWWHPPLGGAVRTRCSDDLLWLPFVTCKYICKTADIGVLDQPVKYMEGRPLAPDEDSYYDLLTHLDGTADLYHHLVKAIKYSLRFGVHGLPLIGSGDWNDGMNLVGKQGKGESVWLAFFLYDVLTKFIPLAKIRNDLDFAKQCEAAMESLKENIEKNGWDGNWYRRAYFDDGTPLGSEKNEECKIDILPQSWSVLSGASTAKRSSLAIKSADKHLVKSQDKLIRLLEPAFDKSTLEPGYIKGYVPGVRENGGQYTHAAIWLIMAFAKMGNSKRAWELLEMINPINHTKSTEGVSIYKVEPYVMAADVYALAPHTGRGGWAYQLITESLLGLKQHKGNKLSLAPCIPAEWKTFKIRYRYKNTYYHIAFTQENGAREMKIKVDGVANRSKEIDLVDDGKEHRVEVILFKNITPTVIDD